MSPSKYVKVNRDAIYPLRRHPKKGVRKGEPCALVKAAVHKAGSLDALALALEVPLSTVWRWFSGKFNPSRMALKVLADYVGS